MMTNSPGSLSRRGFLGALGVGVALGAASSGIAMATTPTAAAALSPTRWAGKRSANGWTIGGESANYRIEGTNYDVTLAAGSAATVLLHALRRFNYEIDTLREGDASGLMAERDLPSRERSNLLSGTAVLIRSGSYPHGTDGNMFPEEIVVIEDIVAEAGGVLGWGGHLSAPDQGLLFITTRPSSSAMPQFASQLDKRDSMSASGGAGQIDSFLPDRRMKTRKFLQQQGR